MEILYAGAIGAAVALPIIIVAVSLDWIIRKLKARFLRDTERVRSRLHPS